MEAAHAPPVGAEFRSPSLVFQETGQAFVDVNGGVVLALDLGSTRLCVRFLVEPIREPDERLLEG